MPAVMFCNVYMLLAPVVQTMNPLILRGKISGTLMALSTGFWIDIYPVERVIHVSHY